MEVSASMETAYVVDFGDCTRDSIVQQIGSIQDMLNRPECQHIHLKVDDSQFPGGLRNMPQEMRNFLLKEPRVKVILNSQWSIVREFLQSKVVEVDGRSIPQLGRSVLDMTAVSAFYSTSDDDARRNATLNAMKCWMKQRLLPKEFLFIELGFDGRFVFDDADFPQNVQYLRIDGTSANRNLFQKEHLWNIAAKMAKHEKLMFMDSDMSPIDDCSWFKQAYDVLDECLFAQGFKTLRYLDEKQRPSSAVKLSMAASKCMGIEMKSPSQFNPGGVYCISRQTLAAIGGFNYLPLGGGDALFWHEIEGGTMFNQPWNVLAGRDDVHSRIQSISSLSRKKTIGFVDADICHFHHGPLARRSYGQRHYMLMTQYPWDGRLVMEDENNLARWVEPDGWFAEAAGRLKDIMNKESAAAQALSSNVLDYAGFVKGVDLLRGSSRSTMQDGILSLQCRCMKPDSLAHPLVSVVVPCYNTSAYIDQCIMSILTNGYSNIEVICVDDRSTDSTVEHIQSLMRKHPRIRLLHNETDHQLYGGGCRNIGLDHASGKYVYFCDSDDYILPGLFKECVERCETLGAEVCGFQHIPSDVNGNRISGWTGMRPHLLRDKAKQVYSYKDVDNVFMILFSAPWCRLYRRDFINRIGARFQEIRNTDDNSWHVQVMSEAQKITHIDKPFYVYRKNTQTSVEREKKSGVNSMNIIDAWEKSYDCVKGQCSTIMAHFQEWIYNELLNVYRTVKYSRPFALRAKKFFKRTFPEDAQINALTDIMCSKPLVSVIVPCYNVEKYIDQCLNSIVGNDYPNLEVICIDDRSTDKTVDRIKAIRKKHPNVRLKRNDTDHQLYGGGCRNLGLDHAKGEYVYFCDSDDYVLPGLFTSCVMRCRSLDADVCCFMHRRIDASSGREIKGRYGFRIEMVVDPYREIFDKSNTVNVFRLSNAQVWDKFYSRRYIDQIGVRFQEGLRFSNDNFWHIATMMSARRITLLDQILYVYRHDTSTSVQRIRRRTSDISDTLKAFSLSYEYVHENGSPSDLKCFMDWIVHELDGILSRRTLTSSNLSLLQKWAQDRHVFKGDFKELVQTAKERVGAVQLVVSFATYDRRMRCEDIYQFLESIVGQSTKVNYQVVMNVFQEHWDNASDELKEYVSQHGIEVMTSRVNYKSNLKYIQAMRKYSDIPVVIVDDDMVYSSDMVDVLYNEHCSDRGTILCGRAREIQFNSDGLAAPYSTWNVTMFRGKQMDIMPIGVGAVLYPPDFCRLINSRTWSQVTRMDLTTRDDFFLHYIAQKNSIPSRLVRTRPSKVYNYGSFVKEELKTSKDGLYNDNCEGGGNDKSTWMFTRHDEPCKPPSVAICALTKNEQWYISDWVEYHLGLGVDHIYIYDAGSSAKDYISRNSLSRVSILDASEGMSKARAYQDCYSRFSKNHDWIAFFDVDEFWEFADKNDTISDILSYPGYQCYDAIRLNQMIYSDDDNLYGDLGTPVWERFTTPLPNHADRFTAKSIVNCHSSKKMRMDAHCPKCEDGSLRQCHPSKGIAENDVKKNRFYGIRTVKDDFSLMFLKYYRTKTASEFKCVKYDELCSAKGEQFAEWWFFHSNVKTDGKQDVLRMPVSRLKTQLEKTLKIGFSE